MIDQATLTRVDRNGNPLRGMLDGELHPMVELVDLDEDCGVWTVTIQLGWYLLDAMVERGPNGRLRTAGPGQDTWLDEETIDLMCMLRISEFSPAMEELERVAINAVLDIERNA